MTDQALTPQEQEQRGEAFAEALFGILALHGPTGLDARELLELGHHLCLTTMDWMRARHLAKDQSA